MSNSHVASRRPFRQVRTSVAGTAVGLLVALLVFVGRAGTGVAAPAPAAGSSSRSGHVNSAAAAGAFKPHMSGVLSDGGVAPTPGWGGYVVELHWKDFEATEQHFTIPQKVQRVIDAGTAARLPVKVRFIGGIDAPAWLVSRVGTFRYTESQSGTVYTMLKFWDPRVSTAYAAAQAGEAALLDGNPTVREVTMSNGMTVYAEPLQSIALTAYTQDIAAGMTDASFAATLRAGIDAHKVWQHTNTDFAFTSQRGLEAGLMDYLRTSLGPSSVLENNSVSASSNATNKLFPAMLQRGWPISFQTASSSRVGSISAALDFAVAQKAMSVETNSAVTPAQLSTYNALLAANTPPGG